MLFVFCDDSNFHCHSPLRKEYSTDSRRNPAPGRTALCGAEGIFEMRDKAPKRMKPLDPCTRVFSRSWREAPISTPAGKRRFHSVSCEMLATVNGQQDVFQELARSANLPLAAGGAVAAHPEPPDPPAGQKEQDGGQRSQQDGPGGPVQQIE